jgi:hypothetical protein
MDSFRISTAAFEGEFHRNQMPAKLTLTSTGVAPSAADQSELFEFLNRVALAQVQFVAVYDLRVWAMPSTSLLRALGNWCKAHEKEFQALQIAIAILLKDNFWSNAAKKMIGVVTAICPPVCPLLMCHTVESVECFLSETGDAALSGIEDAVAKIPSLRSNSSCNFDVADDGIPCRPLCSANAHLLGAVVAPHFTDARSLQADLHVNHSQIPLSFDREDLTSGSKFIHFDDEVSFQDFTAMEFLGVPKSRSAMMVGSCAGHNTKGTYGDVSCNCQGMDGVVADGSGITLRSRSAMVVGNCDESSTQEIPCDMLFQVMGEQSADVNEDTCCAQSVTIRQKRDRTRSGVHLRNKVRRVVLTL